MPEQGWTQVPNYLLDSMAIMHRSTFAVVLCVARKTVGWSDGNGGRKEWDRISLSQFQQATGLSRQGVLDAIADSVERGWIEQRHDGKQSFEYRLTGIVGRSIEAEKPLASQASRPVNLVDQSSELTSASQVSRPVLVNSVDTQKKERNSKEISDREARDYLPSEGKAMTEQQQWFDAMCKTCEMDYKIISKSDVGRIAKTIKVLRGENYTIDDLRRFYRWWHNDDWRGKQGQAATPEDVRRYIGKFRVAPLEETNGFSSNGSAGQNGYAMGLFAGSEK